MATINDPCHASSPSMSCLGMPPVSECMRWQQSVSDEFVRPMHSVLSTTKPICLPVWQSRSIPVSQANQVVRSVDMEL
jgi:hypothetical protein